MCNFGKFGLISVLIVVGSASFAQELPNIDDLSVETIDRMLEEIDDKLALAGALSVSIQSEDVTNRETNDATIITQRIQRFPDSPLCFANNPQPQKSRQDLDAYLGSVEEVMKQARELNTSIGNLRKTGIDKSCKDVIGNLITTESELLSSVSRLELSDLVFHLGRCWPDDNVSESDGTPVNIDTRYARASEALVELTQIQRDFDAVRNGCTQ